MKNYYSIFVALALVTFLSFTVVEGYQVGDVVKDFSLKNIDDTMVSLSDYKEAKGFMVIFTCNSCPYAQAYEDRIIALDKKYKSKGVPVIAIMPNDTIMKREDSFDFMKMRAERKGFTFPYLIDAKQEVFPQFGATRTPHVYLLENTEQGNLVKYIGAIDDNYQDPDQVEVKFVENAVDAMLSGQPIEVTLTKAIGCSIKS